MLDGQNNNLPAINKLQLGKINFSLLKMAKPKSVYSSRSHSNNTSHNIAETTDKSKQIKSHRSRETSLSLNKTINTLSFDQPLLHSIRLVQKRRLSTSHDLVKQYCQRVLQSNTRQNRFNLVDILQELHPFFSKIHTNIAQAIVLLGKIATYYKGQLIFEGQEQEQKHKLSSRKNVRSKDDIGFVIYGKMQLCNDRQFYSHFLNNDGTLFENKFLGRHDKIEYYANVSQPTFVLWLSRQSYYIIRKECFLSLDLKYKFGEFQNLLKFNFISKKLIEQARV